MHTTNSSTHIELPGRSIALMVLCALAVVSLLYLPLPILPEVASTYSLPQEQASMSMQVFGFAYALGFLVFGPLSDRLGRRRILIGGLLTLTIITVFLAWTRTSTGFIAGRAMQGLAAASFAPVALAYLSERGTATQRAKALAWMSIAFLSAGLLGQIYGSEIGGRWGIAMALLPLAAIYTWTAIHLMRASPPEAVPKPATPLWAVYQTLPMLLRDPALLRVYVPALLLLMSFVAYYIGLDIHAATAFDAHGLSRGFVRAVALPAFLMPLFAARLVGLWGTQRVVSGGLLLAAAGMLLTAATGAGHTTFLLAASIAFVSGVATCVPALISRIGEVTTPQTRGMAVSLYTFALFIGAGIGPGLASLSASWQMQSLFQMLAAGLGLAAAYSVTRTASRHTRL